MSKDRLMSAHLSKTKFFSIKEIVKLNVDQGARYNKMQREAMTPEDQKP
jgi:hypothetical protein